MKARQFNVFVLVVSMALLALLVPNNGVKPSVAQSQRVSPAAPASVPERAQVAQALRSSPVMFIENVGQFADGARFQVRGGMGTMWLAEDAIWITVVERSQVDTLERFDVARANVEREDEPLRGVNLKLSFPDANPHSRIEPFDRLDTVMSYFIGNDPDQWHPDVPVWGGVRYVDLYPGVDLEVTSEEDRWTWRLVCRANCQFALRDVRLHVNGTNALTLDGYCLRLITALGDFTLPLLQAVALDGTLLDLAAAHPTLTGNEIRAPFTAPTSNTLFPIPNVQDNLDDLLYSTFLGGSGNDYGRAISVDEAGSAYVTGDTHSTDFPTTPGAFDTSLDSYGDVFVVKVNASGTGLVYTTFLGGSDYDGGFSISVDGAGSAYVTGGTGSSDFPTTPGAFDTSLNGSDVFVVKLNADGAGLAYATFLGGSSGDVGEAIAVDGVGSAYVIGLTRSTDFPTTVEAFDTNYNGNYDAFVVKMNADGAGLAYATFLGGSGNDCWTLPGCSIAVDGAGSAYVAGITDSSNFPTTAGAFDTSYNGSRDAFLVKVNANGAGLAYATFLGDSGYDICRAISVDGAGSAYMAGSTFSSDFPTTVGAFDTDHNGNDDAFLVKVNASGTELAYATFLGGSGYDWSEAIAVDGAGNAYMTGVTGSTDFPTTIGAFDTSHNGDHDAFVVKINASGTALAYATFLGRSDLDWGEAIAVDGAGSAYVAGFTWSSDFPTTAGAFDTSYNGGDSDAFVAKLAMGDDAENVELVRHIAGNIYAVAVQEDYAYAGERNRLVVLDISDPANPIRVGQTEEFPDVVEGILSTSVEDIFVRGSYAYVATWSQGLWVIDVSNPTNPNALGYCGAPGIPENVFVSNSYAYVTTSGYGPMVVDVSDPANPHEVGYCMMERATDVFVLGSYAYVADHYSGLGVIDVSDPANPHLVGSHEMPGGYVGVYVSGPYAYVAATFYCCDYGGLRVLDISNPANPQEVGSLYTRRISSLQGKPLPMPLSTPSLPPARRPSLSVSMVGTSTRRV